MSDEDYDTDMGNLLRESADLLSELYDPAGVLMFWSARIGYLGDRRPCDMVRDRDYDGINQLNDRLQGLCDGVFA